MRQLRQLASFGVLAGFAVALGFVSVEEARAGAAVQNPRSLIGLHRPSTTEFFLRSNNMGAPVSITTFTYGTSTDWSIAGNWDASADGSDEVGLFRPSTNEFFMRASNTAGAGSTSTILGINGDLPVVGNFDTTTVGDEIGVFRPSETAFYLLDENGAVTAQFTMGDASDQPIAGNWDGSMDGSDEVGLFRPSTNQFFFKAANTGGAAVTQADMGIAGDAGMWGDWDRDQTTTIGTSRVRGVGLRHYFRNAAGGGMHDFFTDFGDQNDETVFGDWDGASVDNGP